MFYPAQIERVNGKFLITNSAYCTCDKPKATELERTHGNTVDAWASNLCLECYLKEKTDSGKTAR